MVRGSRRLLVTLVVVCAAVVAASTAGSAPGARTGKQLVKEYPFAVSVAWNIDDTFTTTCGDKSQVVSGELHVVAQSTKPAVAIWIPGTAFEADDLDPFRRSNGREAWSIQTSTTVDPACAPLQTDTTACSGTWNTKKWSGVAEDYGVSGYTTIQLPVLPVRHTEGKPSLAWRFFCLAPAQTADYYVPGWWGDGSQPVFNPAYDSGPAVPNSPAITDCRQRAVTLRFSDTYTQDDSGQWSERVQTENATATVTLERLNSGVRLPAIPANIPGWANMKHVYGC